MTARPVCAALVIAALSFAATSVSGQAQTLSTASLPSFASNPQAFAPGAANWNALIPAQGFYSFSSGGAGSNSSYGAFGGYAHKFSNNVFLDIRGGSGYAPTLFQRQGMQGFDYASTQFKIGYDLGRVRPYISGNFGVANPVSNNPFALPGSNFNAVMNPMQGQRSFTSVGTGFDIAVTNKLSFGAGVYISQSRGGLLSPLGQQGLQ